MADLVVHTSRCSQFGHPEFRLGYSSDLVTEEDIRYLIDALESAVVNGARFEDGSNYRIGWVDTRLQAAEDGTLTIQEPDMIHTPVWWIDSVNHCLLHRRLQLGVCASVIGSDRAVFPSTVDEAWLHSCFGETDGFEMRRIDVEASSSRWVFNCDDEHHDHSDTALCTRVTLYDVAVGHDPRVIPYLALPPGMSVALGRDGPAIREGDQRLDIRAGSLLDRNFPS